EAPARRPRRNGAEAARDPQPARNEPLHRRGREALRPEGGRLEALPERPSAEGDEATGGPHAAANPCDGRDLLGARDEHEAAPEPAVHAARAHGDAAPLGPCDRAPPSTERALC